MLLGQDTTISYLFPQGADEDVDLSDCLTSEWIKLAEFVWEKPRWAQVLNKTGQFWQRGFLDYERNSLQVLLNHFLIKLSPSSSFLPPFLFLLLSLSLSHLIPPKTDNLSFIHQHNGRTRNPRKISPPNDIF